MGLDFGEKRIGVAISDPDIKFAIPLTVVIVEGEEETIAAIVKLIKEYEVTELVVGLPRRLDGTLGRQAEKVQAFIDKLAEQTSVRIETWDEWLSTVAAENLLIEAGIRKGQRKARRDAMAAAFILQGYLDSRQRVNN